MKKKRKNYSPEDLRAVLAMAHSARSASEALDIPLSTLTSAMSLNEPPFPVYRLGDGRKVVLLSDIREYKKNPPPQGKPAHKAK